MIAKSRRLSLAKAVIGTTVLAAALAGCAKNKGELVVEDGVGVTALRTACPLVEIPEMTGDVTLFSAPGRTDSQGIDLVASITNLRSTCAEGTDPVNSEATFDVLARRTDTRGARHVELPYFSVVMRGGTAVVAKRLGTVALDFADGQDRATGHAKAAASVDRAAASLPDDVRRRLSRKRRAGEADAAVDPLSLPEVKKAIASATFEHLIGFQLSAAQLEYNARR
ncbi:MULTISPECIES: hypothetical protein [unclassified Novosphingobium]|uniref:hypothetical protein n=1 Tax=Novosphingobium TaxID=165696 RepID=UPI001446444F|nr:MULTISPECIES: hypothetical protein [unclassified Novosphingobium]NKJ40999.1 hypothetical protein [Novosphingobium sp. SG720]NMN03245.1 hypothetical protein [Novosphingobium sp. SG919]NMN86765.1 hypothetical protein [Novosphingobium sp. SG916]